MLKEKILGVAQQHDALLMYILMHQATVTYYYVINKELFFVDRTNANELSSRHLLCLLVEATQKYREIFGLTLPMNGLRDFNAYALRMERDSKEGKPVLGEGPRNPRFRTEQRNETYGERQPRNFGKKIRRV